MVNTYTHVCWARGARTTGTPPGRSTNIHIHVGPGGPYARDPAREINTYTQIRGARGPVRQGPRAVNKNKNWWGPGARNPGGQHENTFMWGPRARMPGTPGSQQIYLIGARSPVSQGRQGSREVHKYTVVLGPGPPYARDPGRLTHVQIYVEPGSPNCQRPREVNTYTQVCGALEPRMPGTPGSKQINTLMWGPRTRMPGTPGDQQIYTIM